MVQLSQHDRWEAGALITMIPYLGIGDYHGEHHTNAFIFLDKIFLYGTIGGSKTCIESSGSSYMCRVSLYLSCP